MARVLITNFHPTGGGGHVPYIEALTKLSDTQEHVIGVAAPKTSRIYEYLKTRSYPHLYTCDFPAKIQKELPSILNSFCKFNKIVDDFKPDIVHTNGGADLFIALWSRPFFRYYKVIRTHHAINSLSKDPYHKYLYQQAVSANIYVSKSSMELSTAKGLLPSNAIVIENGIDLTRYQPLAKDNSLSKQYGIFEDTFCFGSCAGTGKYKRIDIMIRAASMIKNKNFKILVLGEKSSGDKLMDLATSLGVKQFEYCGFHKDVIPYISLFDAGFILSDSIETISFAAREMMAMGKPLISSSFSGLKENVLDGINGLLVKPDNVEEVAEAMNIFLEMGKDKLNSFSIQARNFSKLNFDINQQLEKHSSLYINLSADKATPKLNSIT
jgi:L-malate glycosyltransferase